MDYKILESGGYLSLEKNVKLHIRQGWTPLGGISILDGKFYQAMIKEEK